MTQVESFEFYKEKIFRFFLHSTGISKDFDILFKEISKNFSLIRNLFHFKKIINFFSNCSVATIDI